MIEIKEEIRLHSAIFFLYGFFGMAWVPRFPELKAFLGLTNGEFGSLITAGTFGALASLLSMGHVVHKYGVRRVLFWSNFAVALSLIVVVNISSSLVFLICNITFGFALASFHLAANAHAFHIQKRTGGLIISRFHGAWAIGVVATSIISGAVSEFIPLNRHIEIVVVLCTFALIYALKKLGPALDYHDDSDGSDVRIRDIFKSFKVDWLVSFNEQMVPLFEQPYPEEQVKMVIDKVLSLAAQQGVGEAPVEKIEPEEEEALIALDVGDYPTAEAAYKKLLARKPGDHFATLGLAQTMLLQRTDGVDGAKVMEQALNDPDNIALQMQCADIEVVGGYVEPAFNRLLRLVQLLTGDEQKLVKERVLELFALVDPADPRVIKARAALANALY